MSKTYTASALNQYMRTQRTNWPEAAQIFDYDADGNLHQMYITGDMNCDGRITFADIDPLVLALSGESAYYAVYPNCNWLNADCNGSGTVTFADIDALIALLGGNGADPARRYVWDGENRLISTEPVRATNGSQKAEYAYDSLGRRVQRKVWTCTDPNTTPATWALSEHRKYVWAGWLLLLELDGAGGMGVPPVRKYTWGLDLAGQNGATPSGPSAGAGLLEGAGGIGGLLAVHDRGTDPNSAADDLDYVYLYDANGNIGQVLDPNAASATAALKAKYQYDPYGNRINFDPNAAEYEQPWRFSTKQFDAETGLGYWDERYYSAGLGRWVNRDPLEELGGDNLYVFGLGDSVNRVDPRGGLSLAPCPWWDSQKQWPRQCPKEWDPDADACGRTPMKPCSKCPNCEPGSRADPYGNELGAVKCENGKPCTCICTDNIKQKFPGAAPPMDECVRAHERKHYDRTAGTPPGAPHGCPPGQLGVGEPTPAPEGQSSECKAQTAGMECIEKLGPGFCGNRAVLPRKKDRCECLRQLRLSLTAGWNSCTAHRGDGSCSVDDARECENTRERAVKMLNALQRECERPGKEWPPRGPGSRWR